MCRGMILVSEIGDKTFFIAAIMAMKNRRATVHILMALAIPLSVA
jgi:putative Ca2+/H+ antiporter (TMEM165/GDT1 family)